MRLHQLTVTAFGPFGSSQQIDFDMLSTAGIFLLHGPTGAGKTSVLDAVCFALYGAVPGARQSPGASLRSDHAPPDTSTEVCLELTVGGRRLEIKRRPAQPRRKKNGKGFTTERAQSWLREYDAGTGEWQALSRSHQEIGEEITQLVGMSRDQFCQVVLLPQGDFARFLRADAEARGRLLGRLFDTRRFAAVEERLAEQRRVAEQQVRAGDERLLAIAHRMEQAAGAAAGDWPLPQRQPGDPGLADAVLAWAAVARAGARETLDIADCALAATESRQAAARHALDAERELARLQQRYEDARQRAEALEARRPEREELQTRLARARKAELVEPALRLREDADREHRGADADRERARSALPPDLAEAGADQLAGLERKLRQDLGGLEAARRAERRSAEITRERTDLDRQARADDDIIQDAAGWLSGWEGVRRSHQERIVASQEAATRAESLAGRLEPARRRLRAASERDRLATRTEEAEEQLRTARDRANSARENWLDLKERRLRGIAAELAAGLVPGLPCAVCGSAEHPAPARAGDGHVDRAAEEAAYQDSARADGTKADAERELAVVREAFTTARDAARLTPTAPGARGEAGSRAAGGPEGAGPGDAIERANAGRGPADGELDTRRGGVGRAESVTGDGRDTAGSSARRADMAAEDDAGRPGAPRGDVGRGVESAGLDGAMGPDRADSSAPCADVAAEEDDPDAGQLRTLVEQMEREHTEAHGLAAGMHAARETLDRAEREREERLGAQQQAERRAAARTSRREALDREQAALESELARARGGAGSVAEHAALLERRVRLLAEAAEAVRSAEAGAQHLKEADDRLADAAFRAGFDTPRAAAAALLGDAQQRDLQHRMDAWQTEAAAVADRLAESDTRSAAEHTAADPEAARAAHDAAERALRDAASGLAAARDRCAELARLSRQAVAEVRRLGPLREEYDRVARLAGLTAGTSADNERKMRLESYVLAARLEQVAAAATARLQRMSSGRYTLVHSDARVGGKRSGLGLHVVDAWTGSERDTATLSGGETFFASLALALGLADVVTDEAGGVQLDTLFIDEGFGSLDDQTLDDVLDVLDSLRERDRSVGIVSHVADLRRRIPAQLEVVKDRHGSAVRLRAAPLSG
ncbi:SMC family ATPase [Streptomyces sp. NBC_01750]|uniref:SMC family ATPase n=1 Tax=Streptomyces sp. NBC_01750 TaxID=2975928 RepID=UPI002DD88040|nr:SMC family ATPase [Streptomyces sp. NBC_01750]WSD31559.1 SMC family ATPase [Streptomyces sp. NBC_01750]